MDVIYPEAGLVNSESINSDNVAVQPIQPSPATLSAGDFYSQ